MARNYTRHQLEDIRSRLLRHALQRYTEKQEMLLTEFDKTPPANLKTWQKKVKTAEAAVDRAKKKLHGLHENTPPEIKQWRQERDQLSKGLKVGKIHPELGEKPEMVYNYHRSGRDSHITNSSAIEDIMFQLSMEGTEFSLEAALAKLDKAL
jgi:hypothetical protein